jgi:NMD protein affecting ribosome stability and mRNA decay
MASLQQQHKWKITRYQRLKRAGICVNCGKHPAVSGRVLCPECNERNNRRQRKERKSDKWRAEGLCVKCGGERLDGYKLCRSCYDKAQKGWEKARRVQREMREAEK